MEDLVYKNLIFKQHKYTFKIIIFIYLIKFVFYLFYLIIITIYEY